MLERLAELREQGDDEGWGDIELLTDFQLQIEHALDLEGRERVLFVDASLSCPPPYQFTRLHAMRDTSYTSHALTPAAVLYVYEQINAAPAPPAFLLAIRGASFELGESLSPAAEAHLEAALIFISLLLKTSNFKDWATHDD